MYQPALRPDQIRALYQLKLQRGQPMTHLVREAVDGYFAALGGTNTVLARRLRDRSVDGRKETRSTTRLQGSRHRGRRD